MGEMQEKPDAQLLRDYAERRDEAAFCEIALMDSHIGNRRPECS